VIWSREAIVEVLGWQFRRLQGGEVKEETELKGWGEAKVRDKQSELV
jgi:hypothetical protein